MWDGNVVRRYKVEIVQLSENQCGMETYEQILLYQILLVEREPMWDGNACRAT